MQCSKTKESYGHGMGNEYRTVLGKKLSTSQPYFQFAKHAHNSIARCGLDGQLSGCLGLLTLDSIVLRAMAQLVESLTAM